MTPSTPWPRTRIPAAAPGVPDRRLVKRMIAGDEAAFRELLARYRSIVYATAYAVLLDPEEVESTVAEAFADARRTASRFLRTQGSVSGWLTHLTRLSVAARTPQHS